MSPSASIAQDRHILIHVVRRSALTLLATTLLLGAGASGAFASAVWDIHSVTNTNAAPGSVITYNVVPLNVGDGPAPATLGGDADNCVPGAPPPSDAAKCYTVRADFPPELTPLTGSADTGQRCTVQASSITCFFPGNAPADQTLASGGGRIGHRIAFTARVDAGVPLGATVTVAFEVAGGEAANASRTVEPTTVSLVPPPFGIDAFDVQSTADAAGTPLTQAGAHPFEFETALRFNTRSHPAAAVGDVYPVESTRDIVVDLPAGAVGDPTVVDRCSADQLASGEGIIPRPLCPPTSQVGIALVPLYSSNGGDVFGPLPVFNMVPPPNAPARLGFQAAGTVVTIDATLRTDGDYGLRATASKVTELGIQGTLLTLWGVPSDPIHDLYRACPGERNPYQSGLTCSSGKPLKPFLRNPTSCTPGVDLLSTVSIDSWEHPGVFVGASDSQQEMEGCALLPFDPRLNGGPPAGARAGAPTAMSFDLSLTQTSDPDVIGTADIKQVVATLPEGVRVSPSSADGLQGCSPAQIALRSAANPTCPVGSRIGSVTIDTPLLEDPLSGGIYLATPFDNPFDSLIAVYIAVRGQGVAVKLPGKAELNPDTGQITTTFDNNPQAPIENVHLQFEGGPRAPLSLPNRCGTYTMHSEITSWSGRTVSSDSSFTIDQDTSGQPCPPRFSPRFEAGTESNSAGSSSSFVVRITRDDLDQEIRAVTVHSPGGVTGRIADVPLCGDAAAAAGTCPEASRIGDVIAGAGAGSNPFFITNGRAYLTGPYKGGPFGLSIVVPAVAGPFDLGNVVVRSSIRVDDKTAELDVVTDTLPRILQGIPLDVRDIRVNVNRPGFFLNATSCAEKRITAQLESVGGLRSSASTRYQASDCASLGFRPRMVLTIGGRGHTTRGRTTPLSTTLTMPPRGQANLRFVRVTLPKTMNARLNTIQDACTRAEFESDISKCAHARAGTVRAVTPLLRDPLSGNVYFVKNGNPIPDLFVALRGQVDFDLVGVISIIDNSRLRTTFATAPDVPVRSFSLKLAGDARNASLGTLVNLCSKRGRRAKVEIDYIAQNGRVRQVAQPMVVKGCGRARAKRRR